MNPQSTSISRRLPSDIMTGSEPALNDMHTEVEFDKTNTFRRKRKTTEDDISLLFDRFTQEISNKLHNLKSDLESRITDSQNNITTAIKNDLDDIKSELKRLDVNQNQFRADINAVKESLEFQSDLHRTLVARVDGLTDSSRTYDSEMTDMKAQIRKLQSELDIQQQRDRAQNLEIAGVPEGPREDLSSHFTSILKVLGVAYTTEDIMHITRVRPFNVIPGRPKAIIVKLKSIKLRDSILSAVRAQRGLSTSDIGINGAPKKIYINEHLTPANKMLHKNVRDKAKAAQYQFVWIRDGKIFVRKDETSSLIRIASDNDLRKIM